MTSYIFLCLLHFLSARLSSGEPHPKSNTVYTYGLPDLTRDILEKIKAATGQPINTNHFIPILAASSKGYEVLEHQPFTRTTKYLRARNKKKHDGGNFHSRKGKKGSRHEKEHYYDLGEFGRDGDDLLKFIYGENEGNEHRYHEGRFVKKNHHKGSEGQKGSKSKKGRKHSKSYVEKGFRDIYHRDEEKKSDYFWNNKHEEGKWVHYGLKNRKTEKSHDKGEERKKERTKTEGSEYEKKEKKCTKCKTH